MVPNANESLKGISEHMHTHIHAIDSSVETKVMYYVCVCTYVCVHLNVYTHIHIWL